MYVTMFCGIRQQFSATSLLLTFIIRREFLPLQTILAGALQLIIHNENNDFIHREVYIANFYYYKRS